ncbi:coronin-2b-like isoform 1 protein [Lasius niger]|uniref:Coronin n=1 Tax=Lasius niger TaxID=67767 RepID=A0A0J7NLY3_LASNI|nr:coronin-2b-like isoform 1 protein [Lasius niger]
MGYDVVHREMIRTREELAEKLGFDGAEEQHAIMNNMVDARACYKPSGKSWFRGVRSSKFRHVYGVPAKREKCYDNIKITKNAHDSQFCAVNSKFLAVVTEVAGGGAFLVLSLDRTGRLDFNASRVTGHTGPVLDIKWNPFNDNIIASCSDDCTIKLWHIPDGGLSRNLTEWLVELQGHKRRVAYIEWHPVAENVLFSAGFDHLVIVWDVNRCEAVSVIDRHPDVIYSISLNRDGSLLATTCKDKKLRVFEPRSGIVVSEGVCHAGTKASKVVFLGSSGRLLTTGFSRHSDRQYAIWSQHDLTVPLMCETIDSSSGVVFPFYDNDTNMVFLAGKGDGNIRYYEIVNEAPWMHYLSQFISGNPQRGLGVMPKRGINTALCGSISTHKPRIYKPPQLPPTTDLNNKKKFAFLSTETIPDYRPVELHDMSEKSQKTSSNQSTKFQQLQQKFGNVAMQKNIISSPLNDNKVMETVDVPNNEAELRLAFARQTDELRLVRRQLANSQLRVKELEDQIRKLQRQ